ncbi:nucleotide-binding domain containing protein, partial [Glutamicibacter halophytocola]|uniref:nucleotide-binding domain containing protein n=1 Tax=Glutamicibacter halophytocola TaxID=1933880 RepID=UPI001D2D3E35
NLNAELSALADSGYRLIIAGALPHLERTVDNGRPLVAGQPLASTDAWQVEAGRAPESITDLLGGLESATLARPSTDGSFQEHLAAALGSAPIAIVDCSTEADLHSVTESWLGLRAAHPELFARSILVGTGALNAALASALAAHHGAAGQGAHQDPAASEAPARHLLGVVGSASGSSGQQLELAQNHGIPCAETIGELPAPEPGQPMILRAARNGTEPAAVLHQLRNQAAAFLATHPDSDLFLTGGETARAVLDDLGVTSLVPRQQLEPGVVICQAPDGRLVGAKPG